MLCFEKFTAFLSLSDKPSNADGWKKAKVFILRVITHFMYLNFLLHKESL